MWACNSAVKEVKIHTRSSHSPFIAPPRDGCHSFWAGLVGPTVLENHKY